MPCGCRERREKLNRWIADTRESIARRIKARRTQQERAHAHAREGARDGK
jgi:dsDNA-binding SOS-regulon protein